MYRYLNLKLNVFDDFQQVRGFLRGLHPKIQKNVKNKDSQTLKETIKQAHVFNEPNERDDDLKASQRNTRPNNFNDNKTKKKCKFNNDTHTKGNKPKSTSRPLSKEDYERAQRKNLCFMCLGNHNKKNCPKLTKARHSQSKQVHMVQVLPLELSSRYSSVEVSHMDVKHECQLSLHPCGNLCLVRMS